MAEVTNAHRVLEQRWLVSVVVAGQRGELAVVVEHPGEVVEMIGAGQLSVSLPA
jgi:hypothetical protein